LRQAARDQREAARGGPDGDLAGRDAGGFELLAEQLLQIGARAGLHTGGDFLAAQFQKEIGHDRRSVMEGCAFGAEQGHADHPAYSAAQRPASLAMWASQLPRARSRTRAM